MVYECPQCKTALSPGSAACPNCGLKFETPTPADATLPPPEAAAPAYASAPPAYASAAYASALPGSETGTFAPPPSPARKTAASVAGLVALCVLLVVLAIFAVKTFFQQETASNPPAAPVSAPAPGPASSVTLPPRTAVLSGANVPPVTLSPGTAAVTTTGVPDSTSLVGRWQSKNADYYVFSGGGGGTRGNQSDGRKETPFHWILADNQLILNGAREEHLTYSSGPDANTMYLRSADGKYEAFTRTASQ